MIIDKKFKVIFLHNPKCGGRFFQNLCEKYRGNSIIRYEGVYWTEKTNVTLTHISLINLPRFVPDYKEYRLITFVRNPYNRFASAVEMVRNLKCTPILNKHLELCDFDTKKFCLYLKSLNYYEQDQILRNQPADLLLPQHYFAGNNVITLKYESEYDWKFIFNLFKIPEYKLRIKEDYTLDDETKRIIRELYFDDEQIFQMYDY